MMIRYFVLKAHDWISVNVLLSMQPVYSPFLLLNEYQFLFSQHEWRSKWFPFTERWVFGINLPWQCAVCIWNVVPQPGVVYSLCTPIC